MKRRLFIGSSSEHIDICKLIKKQIDAMCRDWLDVEIWNNGGVFELNRGTLEVLARAAKEFDYGVFVAAPDDKLISRGMEKTVTRDNVIFEAGLFIGGLGINRTFIVSNVSLPSDFNGSTVINYEGSEPKQEGLDLLVSKIQETKARYRFDHMHSSALAFGYYNGYLKPLMRISIEQGMGMNLSIIVPRNVSELSALIQKHKQETNSKEIIVSNYTVNCKRAGKKKQYWDIPRSLRTLKGLVGYSKHRTEIGGNTDWNQWMTRELENFCEMLQVLIDEDKVYHENLTISRL